VALLAVACCASLPSREQLAEGPPPHATLEQERRVADGRAQFRQIFCSVLERDAGGASGTQACGRWLWTLADEAAAVANVPAPHRLDPATHLYLVSGAFSECLGDEARPFNAAVRPLRAAGYRLDTIVVSGRSGTEYNARQIEERLASAADAGPIVLVGFSKGASDVLEFLVRYPERAAQVVAVVSVAGSIAGTPAANRAAGLYDAILRRVPYGSCPPGDGNVLDSQRTGERTEWLRRYALPSHVRYYSLVAFTARDRMGIALVPTWKYLLSFDIRNDGQLLARDALIPGSTLLGYVDTDHWSAAMDVEEVHSLLGSRPDETRFPRTALLEAILLQVAADNAGIRVP
jgi:pimeloyl-ACP methyl ester carboxylesterase